ncbi:MAG TPA: cell wall hydrolase, partial [Lachnospiraceae bacterium]|nr:cell wall hydrolase [Lachnospiraceae bacterium]
DKKTEDKKEENKDEKKSEDKSVSSDVSEATAQSSNEAKPAETPAAPAEEAPAVEETKKEEPGEAAPAEDSTAAPAGASEAMLLAALIQCECNGPYEAQLAVGAVVMNRVKSGYGSITNAIYAPHQFGPASSGKLARTLATGAISATAMQAANDAISGVSNVGNARYFRNVSSGHAGIVIGNHVYW